MEDYKEKLKEALNSDNTDYEVVRWIEQNFPELKESEDERIRESLIDMLKNDEKHYLKEIAWLEKQKTSKEALQYLRENHSSSEMSDFQVAMNIAVAKAYDKGYNDGLEKQGEQKGTPCDKCKKEQPSHSCQDITALGRCALEKQGEQKPAEWSEEDEDNFKHLMDEIVCLGNSRNSANRLYYDNLIKFLDELKDRAQPREEWCEKDGRKLDRLIAYFEKRVAFTDNDYPEYVSWLKSLRPQNTWKPSEEQMEALEKECFAHSNYDLCRLLEDLKKLKG